MENLEGQEFAIFAEAESYDKPLIVTNLTFARLLDDIVVPFQNNEPFIVDGVSVTREKIKKLKILKVNEHFESQLHWFHNSMRRSGPNIQKLYGEQYHIRVEAILRENSEDVTAQVIKAFDTTIKPSLKNYIPKREELIQAATKVFIEGMKLLGGP